MIRSKDESPALLEPGDPGEAGVPLGPSPREQDEKFQAAMAKAPERRPAGVKTADPFDVRVVAMPRAVPFSPSASSIDTL